MNNCILMGRLTGDPEIFYAKNEEQTAVAKMCIAVDRPVPKGEEKRADFFRCVCFGARAEFVARYLKKGKRITVQGQMHNESFTGKDGNNVRYTELLAREIEFADGKDEMETSGENPAGAAAAKTGSTKPSGRENKGKKGQGSGNAAGNQTPRTDSARAGQADAAFLDGEIDDEELPFH